MKHRIRAAILLVWPWAAAAQVLSAPGQCSRDSQGNQVCVTTQPDKNVCGYFQFPGGGSRFNPLYCYDVVVQKTRPDGQPVYTRVLGGESDELPRQVVIDAQDNAILIGTTYSTQFPTTPQATQRAYAGPPPPSATYSTPLPPGNDLFMSILTPSGDLLYSTFAGRRRSLCREHAG